MNRTRLLLVLALVIVVAVAVVAYLTLGNGGDQGGQGNGEGTPPRPTTAPRETLPPTATPIDVVEVVVAVQDIPRGVVIEPNMVQIALFPQVVPLPTQQADQAIQMVNVIPGGTFSSVNDVIGMIARTDITREQMILARHIVAGPFTRAAAEFGRTGSDAAAVLEEGRVAIALPIDAITSVAYGIQAGDSVDVMVSMLFVNVDPDFQTVLPTNIRFVTQVLDPETGGVTLGFGPPGGGLLNTANVILTTTGGTSFDPESQLQGAATLNTTSSILLEPSEDQRPRLLTHRTVTDARVIWVGEFPEDGRIFRPAATPTPLPSPTPEGAEEQQQEGEGGPPTNTPLPPRPNIITLGVRPQDAVVLTYMAEAGMPMTFALRSARATGLPQTEPVTLNYIMDTFGIAAPPDQNTFAVEPAIRSIRQTFLGERISLAPADATAAPAGN